MAVISNFEDAFGSSRRVPRGVVESSMRDLKASRKALVIVCGQKHAVTASQTSMLKRLGVKHPDDAGEVRRMLQAVNAAAARSKNSNGTVSEDCSVYCLKSDGSAVVDLSGEGPSSMPGIMNGIDMGRMVKDAMTSLGVDMDAVRLVQGVTATSRKMPTSRHSRPCEPRVVEPDQTQYELMNLRSDSFELMSARSVNGLGQVVGTGAESVRGSQNIPWMWTEHSVIRPGYSGCAWSISEHSIIAGSVLLEAARERAIFCDMSRPNEVMGLDPTDEWPESSARDASDTGLIVGRVLRRSPDSSSYVSRPMAFGLELPDASVLENGLPWNDCAAIAVNASRQILVLALPAPFEARSLLWSIDLDSWSLVAGVDANVFPIGLTDTNVIIGKAKDGQGRSVIVESLNRDGFPGD